MKRPVLLTGLGVFVALLMCYPSTTSWAEPPRDFPAEMADLRTAYVTALAQMDDPEHLTALALVSAGKAWALAGLSLARRYNNPETAQEIEQAERACRQEEQEQRPRPDRLQAAGMRLFYVSVKAVAELGSAARDDRLTSKEIDTIAEHVESAYDPSKGKEHDLVVLSNGTLSMLALALRSAEKGRFYISKAEKELESTVKKSGEVSSRPNLHLRGRLFLMAVNNLKGCFRVLMLFNAAMGKGLVQEVEPVREAWLKDAGPDKPPSLALVVTATALAEATFPPTTMVVGR